MHRPLILLDIDGVINDLEPVRDDDDHMLVFSHGWVLHIPSYMPALIQHLVTIADVVWCTAWEDDANDDLPNALGITPLPALSEPDDRPWPWKPRAAHALVSDALKAGRDVYWIEDFYGDIPTYSMPQGVVFIDTATPTSCVLTSDMLPEALQP